ATDDPTVRINRAERLRDQSFPHFAKKLREAVKSRASLREREILPDRADVVWRFLRVNPSDSIDRGGLLQSYRTLLLDHPLEEAVARSLKLPTELPDEILNDVALLPHSRRRELVKHLLARGNAPIFRTQLSRVLIRCFGDEPVFRRFARLQMGALLDR